MTRNYQGKDNLKQQKQEKNNLYAANVFFQSNLWNNFKMFNFKALQLVQAIVLNFPEKLISTSFALA